MNQSKIEGCLFGMAFGDALGAGTEFLNMEGIRQAFPPNGPQTLKGQPALVTDDTQMALAVGEALLAAPYPFAPDSLDAALTKSFIAWYHDPQNNRAPGMTCIGSIENLIQGQIWQTATNISSKGCGANMRVQPVGLLPIEAETRAAVAQFQAALTHGHPTALAATDLTAFVIAEIMSGVDMNDLPKRVRDYALTQREVYHSTWLGDLWQKALIMPSPQAFIAHGWDECLGVLDRLDAALDRMDRDNDPCLVTGGGWIAEQAFATALLCFLMYPDDPAAVIRRAAFSSGDSDSIACIAGAFAGAKHGMEAWRPDWIAQIEYHDRIKALADGLGKLQ
jgi:ADP-ribosylglycohydrolase